MRYIVAVLIAAAFLSGCAMASKISKVQLGMTKTQVVEIMGKPTSVSAQGGAEYLNYNLSDTGKDAYYGWTRPYYVRIIGGKVESYGRTGDFDSTRTPTVRLESDQTIRQDNQGSTDLYTELKKIKELKDSGVITEEEFQAQKKKLLESH